MPDVNVNWDYRGWNLDDPGDPVWPHKPDNIQREIEIPEFAYKQIDLDLSDSTQDYDYFIPTIGTTRLNVLLHVDTGTIRMQLFATLHRATTEAALQDLDDADWSSLGNAKAVTNAIGIVADDAKLSHETGKYPVMGMRLRIDHTGASATGQLLIVLFRDNNRAA